MKCLEKVGNGQRNNEIDFGGHPDHHLDPAFLQDRGDFINIIFFL